MDDKTKQLAEEAGFMLWTDEAWKPEGAIVDWSCKYDAELQKLSDLIRADERKQLLNHLQYLLEK